MPFKKNGLSPSPQSTQVRAHAYDLYITYIRIGIQLTLNKIIFILKSLKSSDDSKISAAILVVDYNTILQWYNNAVRTNHIRLLMGMGIGSYVVHIS